MTAIEDQIGAITDDSPREVSDGRFIPRTSWALLHDRVTVKVVRTNNSQGHPFQKIAGIPEIPVQPGQLVPETGYAVLNVTGHEACTALGVACDKWGNMKPRHGSHF